MKPSCRRVVGLVGRYAVFQAGARVGLVVRRPRGRLPWGFLPLRQQRVRGDFGTRAEAVAALLAWRPPRDPGMHFGDRLRIAEAAVADHQEGVRRG